MMISMMNSESDPVRDFERKQRAAARVAWAVVHDSRLSDIADPIGAFRAKGWGRYLPTGLRSKSAIDGILSTDTGVAEAPGNAEFLKEVEGASALSQLTRALRVSIDTVARLQVGSFVAEVVDEEGEKPILAP